MKIAFPNEGFDLILYKTPKLFRIYLCIFTKIKKV